MRSQLIFSVKNSCFSSALFFIILLILFSFSQYSPCYAVSLSNPSDNGDIWQHDKLQPLESILELDNFSIPQTNNSDSKISEILLLADTAFHKGQWQSAARYAMVVHTLDQASVKARGILGTIYAISGVKKQAEQLLDKTAREGDGKFYNSLISAILTAQSGDMEKAEELVSSALNQIPGHPVALYYRGSIFLSQNKLSLAADSLASVIKAEPDFSPALALLGQIELKQQNYNEAEIFYKNALIIEPENLIYRRELQGIYQKTDNSDALRKLTEETLYYTPGVRKALLTRGMELQTGGQYEEAISLMDKALNVYQSIPAAHYIKAAAYTNLGDTLSAQENLTTFLAQSDASPMIHHYAGMCYLALNNMAMAEHQFSSAITMNPDMGKSFIPLTIIKQINKQYDKGIEGLMLASSQGEPKALTSYFTANIMLAKGEMSAYQHNISQATGIIHGFKPGRAEFLEPQPQDRVQFARQRNLMVLYFLNGWYEKTIAESRELLNHYPKDLYGLYFKALAETSITREKDAIDSFTKIIQINPEITGVHLGLARAYLQTGDNVKALQVAEKALRTLSEDAMLLDIAGWLSVQQGNPEKGIIYLAKALERDQGNPEIQYHLGYAYFKANDLEQAKTFLKKSLATPKSFNGIENAKRVLATLP